jgi:hypothetical protein
MAKLTAKSRKRLPEKDFALPGPRYPVEDKGHARAALSRAAHNASPEEKSKIRRKVEKKFSGMKVGKPDAKHEPHHAIGEHRGGERARKPRK